MNLPSLAWSRFLSPGGMRRGEEQPSRCTAAAAAFLPLTAAVLCLSSCAPAVAADLSKLSPDLAASIASGSFSRASYGAAGYQVSAASSRASRTGAAPLFRVIVQTRSGSGASGGTYSTLALQRKIRSKVSRLGRTFDAMGVMVVDATTDELLALSDNPAVVSLSPDRAVASTQDDYISPPPPLELNRRAVGADEANQAVPSVIPLTGFGVSVAVIDSGVRPEGDLSGKLAAFQDFVNGSNSPYDDFGHGSHVAGIIAGTGGSSSGWNATQTFRGVAPGAQIIGLKVLDANGSGTLSNVIAALNWCINNKSIYNIRVINMSLGSGVYEPYATDPLCQAAAQASAAGIVVVASTGNWGGVYGGVTAPANHPDVIGVGAANSCSTVGRNDDVITTYSGRGPSRYDQVVKPDLVAPGNNIISIRVPGCKLDMLYPETRVAPSDYLHYPGNTPSAYTRLSGTSMAAPMVAGAAALVAQANPLLTPSGIKAALMYSSQLLSGYDPLLQRVVTYDPFTQGAGLVNIPGAIEMAFRIRLTGLQGQPTLQSHIGGFVFAWTGATLPGLLVRPAGVSPLSLLQGNAVAWGQNGLLWSAPAGVPAWSDELVWGSNISWGGDKEKPANGFSVPDSADLVWGNEPVWGTSLSQVNPSNLVFGGVGNDGSAQGSSLVSAQNISWGGDKEKTTLVQPDPDAGY